MKCISKIFQSRKFKKNPGFIIMIFFLLLFVISSILYFTLGECLKIKKLINEINSQRQNLFDKPYENNEINNKIKSEDEKVDNNNNNIDNKGNKINTKSLIIQVKNKNISSSNRKSDKNNVIIKKGNDENNNQMLISV